MSAWSARDRARYPTAGGHPSVGDRDPLRGRAGVITTQAIIAGVSDMHSVSNTGATEVQLEFDLDRDIDSAARDVQAAIAAARADLPSALPSSPTYRKANPTDAPILIIA